MPIVATAATTVKKIGPPNADPATYAAYTVYALWGQGDGSLVPLRVLPLCDIQNRDYLSGFTQTVLWDRLLKRNP